MEQNIILLFGGDSDERMVSVASAQAMAQAIGCGKLWFWHKDGPIFDIKHDELINHKDPFTMEFNTNGNPIFNNIISAITSKMSDNHVFLLAVHGGSGENGQLQDLFEEAKRPYTGSSAKASRIAFNKVATKECLMGYQVKLAPHVVLPIDYPNDGLTLLTDFFKTHGDLIVKPVCGGSSLDCYFIRSTSDIANLLYLVRKLAPLQFFAEKLIKGREITVGVVEDDNGPMGLPCTEIVLDKNRDFDYQGKYLGIGTKEITPAALPENITRNAQRLAVTAHAALSLDGYSRADMILCEDETFIFLETNTLPGLTRQSLVPQQLAAASISMREFLTQQMKIAQNRCRS